jgi:hypothetical protein
MPDLICDPHRIENRGDIANADEIQMDQLIDGWQSPSQEMCYWVSLGPSRPELRSDLLKLLLRSQSFVHRSSE